MMWLLKARVKPGSEFDLADLLSGEAAARPYAKALKGALAARAREDAAFYFPVEGKDPENELDLDVLRHLEVLSKVKVKEVASGWGFDDDEPKPKPKRGRRR